MLKKPFVYKFGNLRQKILRYCIHLHTTNNNFNMIITILETVFQQRNWQLLITQQLNSARHIARRM